MPGADLDGVHFAMDFLTQQNRRVAGDPIADARPTGIAAKDKIVVVIGGGDTGSDCVGTSIRQGASEVHQFEILPKPPERQQSRDALADVAADHADLQLARGRLPAPLERADQGAHRQQRSGELDCTAARSTGPRGPRAGR